MQRSRREHREETEGIGAKEEGETMQNNPGVETANEKQYERALEKSLDEEGVGEQLATAAIVGLGVAALEVELLPGLLIGVGAMLAPKMVPVLGSVVRPLAKTAIRLGYTAFATAQGVVAEANEQIQDMVAEVKAEERQRRQTPPRQAEPAPAAAPRAEGAPLA